MITNLTSFAIMRSADNQARENIMQKVAEKARHDGERPNANPMRQNVRLYPELSAALDSINERELRMLGGTRKGFSPSDSDPTTGHMLVQIGSTSLKSISVRSNVSSCSSRRIGATRLSLLRGGGTLSCTNCLSTSDQPEFAQTPGTLPPARLFCAALLAAIQNPHHFSAMTLETRGD